MVEIVGWTFHKGHAHHAIIIHPKTGNKHSACGMWPLAHELRPEPRYVNHRCRTCLAVIHRLSTPKPARMHRTAMPQGVKPEELLTYLGWTRGVYDELAHHLIVIDRYHQTRAACGHPFFRRLKNGQPEIIQDHHIRTYTCQACLRSRAYRLHGGAPMGEGEE